MWWQSITHFYHERMRVCNVFSHVCGCLSVCLSVCTCMSVQAITFELFRIENSFSICVTAACNLSRDKLRLTGCRCRFRIQQGGYGSPDSDRLPFVDEGGLRFAPPRGSGSCPSSTCNNTPK